MAEPITVPLGGTEFKIEPLPMRPAKVWRGKLKEKVDAILGLFGQFNPEQEITPNDLGSIGDFIRGLAEEAINAPDTIADLVYEYAPNLRGQVDEDKATDAEMIGAFMAVLQTAYPLGTVWNTVQALTGRQGGQAQQAGPGKLPAPQGPAQGPTATRNGQPTVIAPTGRTARPIRMK